MTVSSKNMPNCVCYVIDDNYLFPTLLSAYQARLFTPLDTGDVVIVCIAEASAAIDLATSVASRMGIKLLRFGTDAIEHMHPMFGRLFINSLLPEHYQRIAYVDGDTQIAGSLRPLLDVFIPEGHFLAVRDPASLFARISPDWEARTKADRVQAGLSGDYNNYLNTGVLVFDRTSWTNLSAATLQAIRAKGDAFKFGDQDPMNLAVGDKCLYIPNRWNFPGFLIGTEAERAVRPIIYHFMSNPRPWLHSGLPWGRKWQEPYKVMLKTYPELAPLAPKASWGDKLKYHVQQLIKCATEYHKVSTLRESDAILQP
ncbi:glycosyltransferase family 8 protein [Asticcacaulis benevestitus]|nr:glycosyltransferase [Asticcacaulis benevestitus]